MIVYENEGHRQRMMRTYHQFAWKILEWRKNPYCRQCQKKTWLFLEIGSGLSWKDQATVDHVVSRGRGGSNTEDNFQLLCGKCNNKKSKKENPIRRIWVHDKELEALRRKSALLDALRQEGVKSLDIWERAQLRVQNSIDNSGT